jgi:hypothetical protein
MLELCGAVPLHALVALWTRRNERTEMNAMSRDPYMAESILLSTTSFNHREPLLIRKQAIIDRAVCCSRCPILMIMNIMATKNHDRMISLKEKWMSKCLTASQAHVYHQYKITTILRNILEDCLFRTNGSVSIRLLELLLRC